MMPGSDPRSRVVSREVDESRSIILFEGMLNLRPWKVGRNMEKVMTKFGASCRFYLIKSTG